VGGVEVGGGRVRGGVPVGRGGGVEDLCAGQLAAAVGVEQTEGVLQLRDGGVAAEASPQLMGTC
jgi:hypothetical protein